MRLFDVRTQEREHQGTYLYSVIYISHLGNLCAPAPSALPLIVDTDKSETIDIKDHGTGHYLPLVLRLGRICLRCPFDRHL
jgi:hypothetical protein